jgi:hypothetical protein
MRFEEFADCQAWWSNRVESEYAWRVPIADIEANEEYNLDLHNPNRADDLAHRPPAELLAELVETERSILEILDDLHRDVSDTERRAGWSTRRLDELLELDIDETPIDRSQTYEIAGVYSFGRGMFRRAAIDGAATSYKAMHRLTPGQIVMSRLKAWEGAIALVPPELAGTYLSPEFPTFRVRSDVVDPGYLAAVLTSEPFWSRLRGASKGIGARRERVSAARLLECEVEVPPLETQRSFVRLAAALVAMNEQRAESSRLAAALVPAALNAAIRQSS